MRRRVIGRPVSVPSIAPPVGGYLWASKVLPPGWVSVGDVASSLGLGRHQARRVIIAARIPTRMVRRAWYDPATGRAFSWRCLGVPADAVYLLLLKRLRRTLKRFPGWSATGRWRQREWRARRACGETTPFPHPEG